MATKSLKYFMRDSVMNEEIVTVPGPDCFVDENGKPLDFEIKRLSNITINKIQDKYRTRKVATDAKGNPYIQNGEVVFKVEKDSARSLRHIMVEALQYPNLKDKELMEFYKCVDVTDMPLYVFSQPNEFTAVSRLVMQTLGMIDVPTADEEIEDAKK